MTAYYELESIRQVLDSYPRMSVIMKDMIIESIIRKAPAADVAPVVNGQWEQCFEDWRKQIDGDKCSVCGFEHYGAGIKHYHYCPNCGAKMDLEH